MKMRYASKEFSQEKLPKNRIEQFFSIIKLEWRTLLLIGLIFTLFMLLFVLCDIGKWVVLNSFKTSLEQSGEADKYASVVKTITIYYNLILIPIFLVCSIGVSGLSRVIQRLCYGEGLLFKFDFLDGIKLNIKGNLIIGLLLGIFNFICQFNITMSDNLGNVLGQIITGVSIALFYGLIIPTLLYMSATNATYKMSFGQNFKNSIQLFVASFFISLIIPLLIYGYTFLALIPNIIIRVLVCVLVIFVISPFMLLINHMFCLHTFDKYINKENYKEIYRKGLRPEEL